AAQREQRQECRDDDGGGKEDRSRYIAGRRPDRMVLHLRNGFGRNRRELFRRELLVMRQPSEDRLHHDDGGIDDQAEIDRADREQIGRFTAYHQNAHGKEQRERNRGADDQRTAEIAQEDPLQQHDQHDAEHHVLEHGPGGGVDEVLAVV